MVSRATSTVPRNELGQPDDFDAFVATERDTYEAEYGSFETATAWSTPRPSPSAGPPGDAKVRSRERAEAAGFEVKPYRHDEHERTAEREARRNIIGTGALAGRTASPQTNCTAITAATYVQRRALEVMRLAEIARVYRAYEDAIATR